MRGHAWDILLQKTGYIREAGRCVVMLVNIASKPFVIVLLDSFGKYTRFADAQRVKYWLETGRTLAMAKPRRAHVVKVRDSHVRGHHARHTRARLIATSTAPR